MCYDVSRIFIDKSQRKSDQLGKLRFYTVCQHGKKTIWECDPDGQGGYMRDGDQTWRSWVVHPTSLWPPQLREIIKSGFPAKRDRCVCGRKLDGLYLCKRCEAAGEKQAARAPKPTRKEKNAARARDGLERWQKKLKLAERKVKEYAKRVRYYERTNKQ